MAGYAAFKQSDYPSARAKLQGVNHPQAIHLLGLVEKAEGNYEVAARHLTRAAALDPSNHEIANNQGLLARVIGDHAGAEIFFRKALELKPNFQSARLSLSYSLLALKRPEQALSVLEPLCVSGGLDTKSQIAISNAARECGQLDRAVHMARAALDREPRHGFARHALAAAKFEQGELGVAQTLLQENLAEQTHVGEANLLLSRIAQLHGDTSQAIAKAAAAFAAHTTDVNLSHFADQLWMNGDVSGFQILVQEHLGSQSLGLSAINLLRKSGQTAQALTALDALAGRIAESPAAHSLRAALLLDLGEIEQAEISGRAAIASGLHPLEAFNLVRALLAAGRAVEALDHIKTARALSPDDQFWLGYELICLRLLGDPRYDELIDYDRHVRVYELPVPDGFANLDAFNAALLEALEQSQSFSAHPLNQSLRGGTQAPHNLTRSSDPVLKAYFRALDAPIRDFMSNLGEDRSHPSVARRTGAYRIAGGWTVKLEGGGFHINHLHPRGWISSSYYVSVPAETAAEKDKSGWIKFGEPPIQTQPALGPEKWVQPKAGMLVLFPSFLWHGTEPIHDGSVRITAPFDVVPV